MKPKYHIVIDEVDNGWVFSVSRQKMFDQAPTVRVTIAESIENVCTMLVAEMREQREVQGGTWRV